MYRDGFFKRFAEVFCAAGLLFPSYQKKQGVENALRCTKCAKNPAAFSAAGFSAAQACFTAIASISQCTPFGSALTATQLRAGFETK